jgi:diadenosine tetraphosphate (Ap4A) HIT family hydrolase
MDKDCIFCKIVKGESPSYKIWEDNDFVAFLNIYPNTEGYTVVASKKHLPSYIFDNDEGVIKKMMMATKKVAKILDNAYEDVGRCGIFFEGFGVDHLHSKIFPMHGTAKLDKWKKIEGGDLVFFDNYPGYITTQPGKLGNPEDLKKVLDKIRKKQ